MRQRLTQHQNKSEGAGVNTLKRNVALEFSAACGISCSIFRFTIFTVIHQFLCQFHALWESCCTKQDKRDGFDLKTFFSWWQRTTKFAKKNDDGQACPVKVLSESQTSQRDNCQIWVVCDCDCEMPPGTLCSYSEREQNDAFKSRLDAAASEFLLLVKKLCNKVIEAICCCCRVTQGCGKNHLHNKQSVSLSLRVSAKWCSQPKDVHIQVLHGKGCKAKVCHVTESKNSPCFENVCPNKYIKTLVTIWIWRSWLQQYGWLRSVKKMVVIGKVITPYGVL